MPKRRVEHPLKTLVQVFAAFILFFPCEVSSQLDPGEFLGCFDVSIGDWTPARDWGGDSLYLAPPSRIRLDTIPRTGPFSRGLMALRVPAGALPSIHRIMGWSVERDHIEFVWTNGFSGFTVLAEPDSTGLSGVARSFWDFNRARQTASFLARRVSCEAPPVFSAEDQRPIFDSITLGDGQVLRLNEHFGPGQEWTPGFADRVYERDGMEVEGMGATLSVQARTNRLGILHSIYIDLPNDFDLEAYISRTSEDLGPPVTNRHRDRQDGRRSANVVWSNRSIRLAVNVSETRAGERKVLFSLVTRGQESARGR